MKQQFFRCAACGQRHSNPQECLWCDSPEHIPVHKAARPIGRAALLLNGSDGV